MYQFKFYSSKFEQQFKRTYLRTCAPSENSGHPALSHSLIRVFTICQLNHYMVVIEYIDERGMSLSNGAVRRLMLLFAIRAWYNELLSCFFVSVIPITKTYLYNFDPLNHHFYVVKPGFTGYTLFFLSLLKNIDCGYPLEPPRRGGSNEYQQSMFWAEIWKKIRTFFFLKTFSFWWYTFQYIWIGVLSYMLSYLLYEILKPFKICNVLCWIG